MIKFRGLFNENYLETKTKILKQDEKSKIFILK